MLSTPQKKYLKAEAHHLDAAILIGKAGVTENLIEEIKRLLEARELVKIKFNDFKSEKASLSTQIAEETKGEVVQILGNVLILFKEARKTENRKIKLPKA